MKYNVYEVSSSCNYSGFALIAAENATEANKFIQEFKDEDKDNYYNSYGYEFVKEYDVIEDIFAERKGFITHGISYSG